MKKLSIITVFASIILGMGACNDDVKRKPGKVYMPDMMYSRAYETYAVTEEEQEELKNQGINYSNLPVAGTVKRGEMLPYHLQHDSAGYAQSAFVKNPVALLNKEELVEAERLYLVNCGICHGSKLDGNGPLWKDGAGPFPAAPKDLLAQDMKDLPDGTMFHSITYGKNLMGSYASQLDRKQRWQVVHYIRSKQGLGGVASTEVAKEAASDKAANAAKDSAKTVTPAPENSAVKH